MLSRPYRDSRTPSGLMLIVISSLVGQSYAYYCDHNFCESGSFCCGDNVCCLYLNDHWTYYFCLISVAFLLTAFIWIVYHFMYRKRRLNYKPDEVGFLNSKNVKNNYA